MKKLSLALLTVISPILALAQLPEQPTPEVSVAPAGFNLDWYGHSTRTYFVEYSADLVLWSYMPVIEGGSDAALGYGFDTAGDKLFLRLKYTDVPTSNPNSDDFDGDGVTNWDEVRIGGTGTDPFKWDTDGDGKSDYFTDLDQNGLADGWELKHYGAVGIAIANEDTDNDGQTAADESLANTDPNGNAETTDSDNDGVMDADDAVPGDALVNWPSTADTRYALIELPDAPIGGSFKRWNSGDALSEDGYVLADVSNDADSTGNSDWNAIAKLGDTSWSVALPTTLENRGEMDDHVYTTIGPGGLVLGKTVAYRTHASYPDDGEFRWMTIKWAAGDTNAKPYHAEESSLKIPTHTPFYPNNYDEHLGGESYESYSPVLAPDGKLLYQRHGGVLDSAPIENPTKFTLDGHDIGYPYTGDEGRQDFEQSVLNELYYDISAPGAGSMLAAVRRSEYPWGGSTSLYYFEAGQPEQVFTSQDSYVPYDVARMPDNTGMFGGGQPAILGYSGSDQRGLWIKGAGGWKRPEIFRVEGSHINQRGEIITATGKLWRNGVIYEIEDLCPELDDYSEVKVIDLKDNGQIFVSLKNGADIRKLAVLLPVDIVPDYNRDGKINEKDGGQVTTANPFRWWINDDNDATSAERGTNSFDIPKQNSTVKDCNDLAVDGMRDLIDFFPLHIDLKQALDVFPASDYKYQLKHEDEALNFFDFPTAVLDGSDPTRMLNRHITSISAGRGNEQHELTLVSAEGVNLSTNLLSKFKEGKGVIYFEGAKKTEKPLILEIKKNDGTSMAELKFPIRIVDVEDMYRHVNMRSLTGGSGGHVTQIGESSGYPDDLTNGKYVAYIHGFNITGESARGSQSNIFKRFHQFGSKARYIGISWHGTPDNPGNTSIPPVPDYHLATYNALVTGENLKGQLGFVQDADLAVIAHSLGNLVASNAIANPVASKMLSVSHYYIINGAVPLQAYDEAQTSHSDGLHDMKRSMTEDDWKPYYDYGNEDRLLAANWHNLFKNTPEDNRNKLTWKDLFSKPELLSVAYNFYSPDDEVVENANENSEEFESNLVGSTWNWEFTRHAWVQQEIGKGGQSPIAPTAFHDINGGWQFRELNLLKLAKYSPEEAETEFTDASLKEEPFYKPFLYPDLYDPALGSGIAAVTTNRYKLLGTGIPATSYAIAANEVTKFNDYGSDRSHNMPSTLRSPTLAPGSWPVHENADDPEDWMHSDFKDVALHFLHPMYKKMIDLGNLNTN